MIQVLSMISEGLKPINSIEIILYLIIYFLLCLICILYYNNNIQHIVNRISRCVIDARIKSSANNVFTATGIVKNTNKYVNANIPVFDITYDLNRKQYSTKCLLPEGSVANKWPVTLPTYNFIEKQTGENMTIPVCYSDKNYINNSNVTYIGYGPLVDFIVSDGFDTNMFNDGTTRGNRYPASLVAQVATSNIAGRIAAGTNLDAITIQNMINPLIINKK